MQVRDILQPRAAEALLACLRDEVKWTLAVRRNGRPEVVEAEAYAAMDVAERTALLANAAAEAESGYGFAYERYPMIQAAIDGRDPELVLHVATNYLNSPEFLGYARTLTALPQIRVVSAQATCFRAGHFLRLHDDLDRDEGRLVAYVINLTPKWDVDAGGLLHFIAPEGGVDTTYYPWFNSLSVFTVPRPHFVGAVAQYATDARYSITGWFRT